MRRVRLTIAAANDLEAIWAYIAKDSESAATRYLRRLDARMRKLPAAPQAGERQDRFRPGLRSIVEGSHVIFYEVLPDAISIYRVIHGARDLPLMFSDDDD